MVEMLRRIVADPELHSRWLNTLSMMENSGAKKIKRCEHPLLVDQIILKHAAEEARHAYYLKRQIAKIDATACPTYEAPYLIAANSSYSYISRLDVDVCRYLKKEYGYDMDQLKYAAYLLVTYAIEVRADELYPIYQDVLNESSSNVSVRSIIAEEENHLYEIGKQLKAFTPEWEVLCEAAIKIESKLFEKWIDEVRRELKMNPEVLESR